MRSLVSALGPAADRIDPCLKYTPNHWGGDERVGLSSQESCQIAKEKRKLVLGRFIGKLCRIEHSRTAPRFKMSRIWLLTLPGLAGQTESGKIRRGQSHFDFQGCVSLLPFMVSGGGTSAFLRRLLILLNSQKIKTRTITIMNSRNGMYICLSLAPRNLAHWAVH